MIGRALPAPDMARPGVRDAESERNFLEGNLK
jgi:hypothetical protein